MILQVSRLERLSLNKKIGTLRDWKALKTGHFRSLCFCSGSILVLLSGGIMWFYVELVI